MVQVEQELLSNPEYLSSPLVCSGVRVPQSSVFCVVLCLFFFLLAIMFAALIQITASSYPLDIFQHILTVMIIGWFFTGSLFVVWIDHSRWPPRPIMDFD